MATYKAEIKTVPTGSSYTVTVESGSISTARQEIEHLYRPIYIRNLRQVGSGGGSSSIDGGWTIIFVVLGLWLAITYWPIILGLGIIWAIYKIFS